MPGTRYLVVCRTVYTPLAFFGLRETVRLLADKEGLVS